MAYKEEYVIDSCTMFLSTQHKVLWISEAIENVKPVNETVRETCEGKKIYVTGHKVKNREMQSVQEAMVGGSHQLYVILLVGMPRIGKTTLAEKIQNDLVISSHFDEHAQCRVTQVYSWRDLSLAILNGVLEPINYNEK